MLSIINYETLYDLLRREKTAPELQKIAKTFPQDVKAYLKEKQEFIANQSSNSSAFSQKESGLVLKQVENTKRLVKEICEKREAKIISLALSSVRTGAKYDTSSLLNEELVFYEAVKSALNSSRHLLLDPMLSSPEPLAPQKTSNNLKQVKFLNPTPQFLGMDMNSYGPFDQDYIASLPEDIAGLLIKTKRAEEL
ncbi:MAG TPA: hypothetical protein VJH95_03245 [Candidatus Nanoarchaeia archaeon]|nr:hypothetical protein [Candidatus Nanoarchaeia archaeon]